MSTTIQKKVCMLGEFGVGKTSLVTRFVENKYDDSYLSTIGVKVSRKPVSFDGLDLNMLLWDLAGGRTFGAAKGSYLKGASGALIVFDLTRQETFDLVSYYLQQLMEANSHAALVLIGNKTDLHDQAQVSLEDVEKLAQELACPFFMTSAKSGSHVEEAFERLGRLILKEKS